MGHSSISTAGASFFSKRKEDAGTRLPPVEGCGTYTRLLPIRILYLPRRSLAMPRTSHLTANTIHHRRTPEATAIPNRIETLTTPRRRQCPHRAGKPGAARREREGRAARAATAAAADAVTYTAALAVALAGRWRARFACACR